MHPGMRDLAVCMERGLYRKIGAGGPDGAWPGLPRPFCQWRARAPVCKRGPTLFGFVADGAGVPVISFEHPHGNPGEHVAGRDLQGNGRRFCRPAIRYAATGTEQPGAAA